jgi:hypothetical protein
MTSEAGAGCQSKKTTELEIGNLRAYSETFSAKTGKLSAKTEKLSAKTEKLLTNFSEF